MNTQVITPGSTGFSNIMQDNSQALQKIDKLKNTKITSTPRNLIFGGLAVLGIFMTLVFAVQIITGMFALILTGVTLVGGFLGLRFLKTMDPVIRQKTKNLVMEKMVEEAQENAIYQLDNQVILNKDRLEHARNARNKMGALVQQLKGSIKSENKGKAIYERKMDMLVKVQLAYETMCSNLKAGAEANEVFKAKVNEYRDMNKFANIAGEAMALLGASGSKELEEMLSLEAFSAIDGNFNTAIISIENSANDMAIDGGYA